MNRFELSEPRRNGVVLLLIALAFVAICAADSINDKGTKDSKKFKNATGAGHFYANQNNGYVGNYGNQPYDGYDIGNGPQWYAAPTYSGHQPNYGYNHHLVDDYVCDVDASILVVTNSEQAKQDIKKTSDQDKKAGKQERDDTSSHADSNSGYGSNLYSNSAGGSKPHGKSAGSSNPYGTPAGGSNPYGTPAGGSNPYGNSAGGSNPYGNSAGGSNPYVSYPYGNSNPYGSFFSPHLYGGSSSSSNFYGGIAGNLAGGLGGSNHYIAGVANNYGNNYGPSGYVNGQIKHAIAHRLRCSVIAIHNDTACTTCCQLSARRDKSISKDRIVGFIADGNQIRLSNAYRKKRDASAKTDKLGDQKNSQKEVSHGRPEMPVFPPQNPRCVCCAPKHHYDNQYIGNYGKASHDGHNNQHFGGSGQHHANYVQQFPSYAQPQGDYVKPPPATPYNGDDYGHAYLPATNVYGGADNVYGHAQPSPRLPPHGNTGYVQPIPSNNYGKEQSN